MRLISLTMLLAACAPTVKLGTATLAVPPGWSLSRGADRIAFEDPDRQLRVTVLEAADIGSAWQKVDPQFALSPAEPPDSPPPNDGWDAMTTIRYAGPNGREARAEWRRFGGRSWAVLIDGKREALERRDAQIETLLGSLRPAGMRPEQLHGTPRPLDAAKLDEFVGRALTTLAVPGAAIAVIVDGKVVYERVLGVRALGDPAAVTPDTRFLIASITKPMTTLMQAALVDAGKLRWDTPVTTLLPDFALADPNITRELRLWHMSCACTGMPRQDLEGLFEWDGVTPEARLAVMRTMKPTTRLGETFQYSNPMVAAGGFAAARAFAPGRPLAEAYAAAMQSTLFDPMGLGSTTLDFAVVERGEHARPHALDIGGETRVLPLAIERGVLPIAPAGGVWTTLRDFERYAQTELAEGVAPNGRRIVSTAATRERTRRRVRADATSGYGLGIDVGDYSGLRVFTHSGGSFGFGSSLLLFPDARVGIVVLTNIRNGNAKEQLPFNAAVKRRIIEELFGARPLAEEQLRYYAKLRQRTPHVVSSERAWIDALAGRYHHPALGHVEIRRTDKGALFDVGEWSSAIDRVVAPDGSAGLMLLDPPLAGGVIVIGEPGKLILPGQVSYTLSR